MKKYTYLLGWSKLNKWYYGRRTANKTSPINDFWKIYKSSSKIVKDMIKLHGEPDIREIRKIFNTFEECEKWEIKVLKRMNCVKSDKWLNRNDTTNFYHAGPCSKEYKKKLSVLRKGKPNGRLGCKHSLETRLKISKRVKGKLSGNKHPLFGKHHTDKTRQKIKNNHWSKKGGVIWNKGLTKNTDERVKKITGRPKKANVFFKETTKVSK